MKFFVSALLALSASAVQGRELQAAALEARWNMDEPLITYDAVTNLFTLDFPTASASNTAAGMAEEFYDVNCKDDGSGAYTEYIIPAGITDGDGSSAAAMDMDGGIPADPRPQLDFMIDTQVLANDANIYTLVTQAMADDPALDYENDDVGKGEMKLCVRSSLGYVSGTFQEVNFIESLITIKYDLTAGFSVDAFSVEPKEREETTAAKDTYALEAYLCNPAVTSVVAGPARTIPDQITDYDVAGGTDAFNQGALITVCVLPDGPTYSDGIILNGLEDFTWTRDSPLTNQEAIIGGAASLNGLTSFTGCSLAEWCHFSSILFADFYISAGAVYGSGNADLTFRTRRRLGATEEENRRLEEDAATSPFDLSVQVTANTEGPGALKTAGGAAFGLKTLASVVALASAALLA